jgi:hypothetical protein
MKRVYALWTYRILDPDSYDALNPVTILYLCDKQSFTQPLNFLCRNATCEMHARKTKVHVRYLFEKRFLKESKKKIAACISVCYSFT